MLPVGDELLEAIKERVVDELGALPSPLGRHQLDDVEMKMGSALHPLHKRLLLEVGGVGWGPGYGVVGIAAGKCDATLLDAPDMIPEEFRGDTRFRLLPFCEWGGAIWTCLDSLNGRVLTLAEGELTDTEWDLEGWLADWLDGVDVFEEMFDLVERNVVDPFSKRGDIMSAMKARGQRYSIAGEVPGRRESDILGIEQQYEELTELSRVEAEVELGSGNVSRISTALVRLALHDPDPVWLQGVMMKFIEHEHHWVRGVAAIGFEHIARIHGVMDVAVVAPALKRLLDDGDAKTRGHAEDAFECIEMFVK